MKTYLAGALSLGLLGGLGVSMVAAAAPGDNTRRNHIALRLRDAHGARVAQVDITVLRGGANRVAIRAWNLTPGFHGVHIHAAGVCDPSGAKPFASAGGHYNPTGAAEGMQAGAFPVLLAGARGTAETQFIDGNFRLANLFGPEGTSIVIHSAPDNYANIPARYTAGGVSGPDAETQMTGDAGSRVACGVISAPRTRSVTPASPTHHTHAPTLPPIPTAPVVSLSP